MRIIVERMSYSAALATDRRGRRFEGQSRARIFSSVNVSISAAYSRPGTRRPVSQVDQTPCATSQPTNSENRSAACSCDSFSSFLHAASLSPLLGMPMRIAIELAPVHPDQ